jgi:hypothetical protein
MTRKEHLSAARGALAGSLLLFGITLVLPAVLEGCAQPSTGVSNSVIAAERTLTLAEQTAKIYTDLPRCGSLPAVGKPFCSDPALVAKMADADNKAYAAVKAAQRNEALLGAALDAIAAYQSLTLGR